MKVYHEEFDHSDATVSGALIGMMVVGISGMIVGSVIGAVVAWWCLS